MSFISNTVEGAKEHPLLLVGAIGGIVVLYFLLGKSSAAPVVQYNVGPTAAQAQAGAAIQMSQIAANAQTSIASINASAHNADTAANSANIKDYFSYLTAAGNQKTALAEYQTSADLTKSEYLGQVDLQKNLYDTASNNSTKVSLAQLSTTADLTKAAYSYQTTLQRNDQLYGLNAYSIQSAANLNGYAIQSGLPANYTPQHYT